MSLLGAQLFARHAIKVEFILFYNSDDVMDADS